MAKTETQHNTDIPFRAALISILDRVSDFAACYDTNLRILDVSASAANLVSGSRASLQGRHCYEVWHNRKEPCENCPALLALDRGKPRTETVKRPDGKRYRVNAQPLHDSEGKPVAVIEVANEVTEYDRLDGLRDLEARLMRACDRNLSKRELMHDITELIHEWSGCEAVGIRLKEGEDFPYFETRGFPPEFVEVERHLCARTEDGNIVRDPDGNPVLECMCGNVIQNRFDPDRPFFTPNGSFWTNSTSELLSSTSEEDRQTRTRNRCHGEGYESVALIPLRIAGESIGLLQINDKRPNRFEPETIDALERLAATLVLVLRQRVVQQERDESRERYQRLVENSPHAAYRYSVKRGGIYFSNAAARLLDCSVQDLLDQPMLWPESIHPEDRPRVQEAVQNALQGRFGEVEYSIRDTQGRWHYVVDRIFGCIEENGEQILEGLATDVTARRKAERELAKSEENFRTVADHTYDWEYWIDPDGRLLYMSPSCHRISGYEPSEFLDTPDFIAQIVHPEDRETYKQHTQWYSEADSMENASGIEFRIRHRDGSVRWIDHYCTPVVTPDGKFLGRRISNRDETERHEALASLRLSEERFRRMFYEHDAIMLLIEPESGRIVDANRSAEHFYGYDREALQEMHVDQINVLPPEQVSARRREAFENRRNWFFFPHRLADGTLRWVEVHSSPIAYHGEQILFSIIHDTTGRREAEAALEENRRQLLDAQHLAHVGSWSYNTAKRQVYWSPEMFQIMGVDPDEGEPDINEHPKWFSAQDWDRLEEAFQAAVTDAKPYELELDMISSEGQKRRIITRAEGVRLEGGQISEVRGTVQDVTAQKQAEDALRHSLQQKTVLLREVHHRVKNNLAAVVALMELPAHKMETEQDKAVLTELAERVRAIALVHEFLYSSDDLSRIDFDAYVNNLISHIRLALDPVGQVDVICKGGGVKLTTDTAVPCALIINELFTNALKHAWPENDRQDARISIEAHAAQGYCVMELNDNGSGLPDMPEPAQSRSLGMRLMRMLAQQQLGGTLVLESNEGTRASLRFPMESENEREDT